MLDFFRRYEKYVFVAITIVIVISFSFFGTYNTIEKTQYVDNTVFTAIDGTPIKASTLEEMVIFLGTDAEDKVFFGGAWGPNFLNDGVIKKDFLETGLAQILIKPYLNDLRNELEARSQKEMRFIPYENPNAKFISAVNAWNMVAPQITVYFDALRRSGDPGSHETFDTRVKLFQAQRQVPQHVLRYVLRHQERQNSWVNPDLQLDRKDLSLFGYHTISDWFGQGFQRLIAEFIINSAIIAEQQGYEVSQAEVMADLYRNAELSFQQNINNPNLGVATMSQYFEEQLRRMQMDQTIAANIWRKVMLFRRLFQDLSNSVFIDPLTIQQFENLANGTIEGDLYALPEDLKLSDLTALHKFELYLNAVSNRPKSGEKLLDVPEKFKTPDEVAKKTPELVQRRYFLEYAKTNKRALQANVGVKETWEWEVEDKNWEKLMAKFPELGLKPGKTKEERYASLDQVDKKTRSHIDSFARAEIVESHPVWLKAALDSALTQKRVVGIHKKGKNEVFSGLKDPQILMDLLDKYPATKEDLEKFTVDNETFYKIHVLDRSPDLEILTFGEANKDDVLDSLLDAYIKSGGDKHTEKVVEQINKYYTNQKPATLISDYAASHRLFPFVNNLKEKFSKDPQMMATWVKSEPIIGDHEHLPPRIALKDQWKLEKKTYKMNRGSSNISIPPEDAFSLTPGEWSKVHAKANGEIAFLQLKQLSSETKQADLYEKTIGLHRLLSVEAQQRLMEMLVEKMEAKGSLSLKSF